MAYSLPIDDHGFTFYKSAFRDTLVWLIITKCTIALCLWHSILSIEHALTCETGGFLALRHNEVCDITASWPSEVCHAVKIEPHLQQSLMMESVLKLPCTVCGDWGGQFEKAIIHQGV